MPDIVIVAIIAALGPTLAALAAWKSNTKKLDNIHVLVNSRLSEALDEISALKEEVRSLKEGP